MARSLIVQPKILLLDEPLGALDADLRTTMQIELKKIQKEIGITFIYVTHDQEEALTMSDRIVVMNKGTIEQIGTPEEIYESPKNRFVGKFIGRSNFFEVQFDHPIPDNLIVCKHDRHGDTALSIFPRDARSEYISILMRKRDSCFRVCAMQR